ncbi:MAG: hypothetical protein BJ554DRAFT_4090 [Olpidium bornovanus]|uniref:Uncharacterized protein n=1 Tax=Olpidium bornovanus TaxID=278681 RepID=A0A8H8DLX8_9FUNG|nr:MAG: hypothetical protein BJ554DRAFT_4090 [Olpidium bornovanus]
MAPLGPAFVALGCALAVVVAGVPMHRIMDFFHPRRVSEGRADFRGRAGGYPPGLPSLVFRHLSIDNEAFNSNYEGGSSSSSQAPQLPPDSE